MKHALWLAMPLLLLAAQDAPPAPYALATLNVQQGGTRDAEGVYRGGKFKPVKDFEVPAAHGPRDALIAFEGPGWESDKVAYRLYLDERNVPDIYGKKLPGPVLPRIGQGKDDYHSMADWGQDILQVNQTLGAGGLGVMRDGKVTQLGHARQINARLFSYPGKVTVEVTSSGFSVPGATTGDLTASYSISAGSRITRVGASQTGDKAPMVAGIVIHPNTQHFASTSGKWRYIATWGVQSLANDELGLALFYPADNVSETGENNGTFFVRFCNPRMIRYAFAGVWIQEPGAPKDAASFKRWLDETAAELSGEPEGQVVYMPGAPTC
ncbi:MAG: DUF4861 family protein [Sphingomonas sp.]